MYEEEAAKRLKLEHPERCQNVFEHTLGENGVLRIVQITDLHILDIDQAFCDTNVPSMWRKEVGDNEVCLQRTLDVIRRAVESQNVHLAVLTGDIIDARTAKTLDQFLHMLRPLVEMLAECGTPWLYIPGNHEDGHGEVYAREDLRQLFALPGSLCDPDSVYSFDQTHLIRIASETVGSGSVLLQLVDAKWTKKTCFISKEQTASLQDSYSLAKTRNGSASLVKIAFAHEPFDDFANDDIPLIRGVSCYPPRQNMADSGYMQFLKENNFHALFVGHNHHNDFIRWSGCSEDLWLGHGRCGSFFPPSSWEGILPLPFNRGARIFQIDTSSRRLETWIFEEALGVNETSLISRKF